MILDGLDIPHGYTYIYKRDVFRRGSLYYKFKKSCKCCGNSYFMRLNYPTNFCSKACAIKDADVRKKISISLSGHRRSLSEVEKIKANKSKGGVVINNVPLYSTYAKQISMVDDTNDNNGVLEVKCSLCGKWFIPKRTSVEARAQYIKGNTDRESRLYCSDICKLNCPIFNKHKYPKGSNHRKNRDSNYYNSYLLNIWSKVVLERSKYICEYCGDTATTAHHIVPKKVNPFKALDIDNGMACCKRCHYDKAHKDECSTANLAKIECK